MRDKLKWQRTTLDLPKAWMPLIDRARGDQPRSYWIRDLIRDALKRQEAWPEWAEEERP